MKLVFFSDSHNQHRQIHFPPGDVLICCGDLSSSGTLSEIEAFAQYLSTLKYQHKIVIAGNHDFALEDHRQNQAEHILNTAQIHYLNDSGIHINDVFFWGSPIQPTFFDWAFNRQRGSQIQAHWNLIPPTVNVLITHGPPYRILDQCHTGSHVGCQNLLQTIQKIQPQIHAFGHIHEAYGMTKRGLTTFINAAVVDRKYRLTNPCIVQDI